MCLPGNVPQPCAESEYSAYLVLQMWGGGLWARQCSCIQVPATSTLCLSTCVRITAVFVRLSPCMKWLIKKTTECDCNAFVLFGQKDMCLWLLTSSPHQKYDISNHNAKLCSFACFSCWYSCLRISVEPYALRSYWCVSGNWRAGCFAYCGCVAVSASLNGGKRPCRSVTEDSDDDNSVAESDFLFQPISDDAADGNCVQGLTGLYNHGNTCYVNATIQALSNWYVGIFCSHLSLVWADACEYASVFSVLWDHLVNWL